MNIVCGVNSRRYKRDASGICICRGNYFKRYGVYIHESIGVDKNSVYFDNGQYKIDFDTCILSHHGEEIEIQHALLPHIKMAAEDLTEDAPIFAFNSIFKMLRELLTYINSILKCYNISEYYTVPSLLIYDRNICIQMYEITILAIRFTRNSIIIICNSNYFGELYFRRPPNYDRISDIIMQHLNSAPQHNIFDTMKTSAAAAAEVFDYVAKLNL